MRRVTLLAATFALAVAPAMAKPTLVKGAKCTVCHEGTPKDKKFTPAAAKMVALHKPEECANCHAWVDGKLTIIKK